MKINNRIELMPLFKAVSQQAGQLYSLGMGGAPIIHLPTETMIDGDTHGIFACTTAAAAHQVIRDMKRRTMLPMPREMLVVPIRGQVRNRCKQRVVCDHIYIENI